MLESQLHSYTTVVDGESAVAIVDAAALPTAAGYLIFLSNDNACALSDALGDESFAILDIVNAQPTQPWRRIAGIETGKLLARLAAAAELSSLGPNTPWLDYDVVRLRPGPNSAAPRTLCFAEPDVDPIVIELPASLCSIPTAHLGECSC